MDDIRPHVGGTAFVFFLNTLSNVHDKADMHQSARGEVKFLNTWASDMKSTLERHPEILNPNASTQYILLIFETEA